jgi:hypothetical protein
MQREQQSGSSLAETQFYARTSHTPTTTKRHELIYQKSDDIYSTPPIEDTFHDAIDDLNTNKDQIIDDKSKKKKNLHISLCDFKKMKQKRNVKP